MAIDPVCGMTVEPDRAAGHADHEGEIYYFCSLSCLDRFRAAPTQYVKGCPRRRRRSTVWSPLAADDAADACSRAGHGRRAGSGLRHDGPACHGGRLSRPCTEDLLFLLPGVPRKIPRRSGSVPFSNRRAFESAAPIRRKSASHDGVGTTTSGAGWIDRSGLRDDGGSTDGSRILRVSGTTYFFCCQGCLTKFAPIPALSGSGCRQRSDVGNSGTSRNEVCLPHVPGSVGGEAGPLLKCGMALEPDSVQPLPTKTEYVCPMHPEIVQAEPGSCPKCGMALESRTVTVEEELNPELVDMARRFWVGLGPAAIVFVLAMSHMIPGNPMHHVLSDTQSAWIQCVLSTPVVLWAGWPFFSVAGRRSSTAVRTCSR